MGIEHAAEKRTGGCAEALEKPHDRLSNLSDLTQVWDDIYAIEVVYAAKECPTNVRARLGAQNTRWVKSSY
jgi:hypothetical protein